MYYLGNKEILRHYKIGFLCSRKVPANIILKTYDWAIEQRDNDVCVVSSFHSKIEKDVFDILVKGTQPIILVLARGMMKRLDKKLIKLIDKNRLLVMTPFNKDVKKITVDTAKERNTVVAEICEKFFVPYYTQPGSLAALINIYKSKFTTLSV